MRTLLLTLSVAALLALGGLVEPTAATVDSTDASLVSFGSDCLVEMSAPAGTPYMAWDSMGTPVAGGVVGPGGQAAAFVPNLAPSPHTATRQVELVLGDVHLTLDDGWIWE